MTVVSVVIPTKNEKNSIGICIKKIQKVFNEHHIDREIIIADNSTDSTPEIAKSRGAIYEEGVLKPFEKWDLPEKAKVRVKKGKLIKNSRAMSFLYVAPDIPVPHTGESVGGSMYVMKIAGSLAKKGNDVHIISRRVSREQKKYEEISKNIFTRRVFCGLIFPIQGKPSSKAGKENEHETRIQ
jgi:glycosyltransferase involved in cell wall biosynthesis